MKNPRKRRFRDELEHTIEWMGHDLERTADEIRRELARELRMVSPTIVRMSERAATGLWRRADSIDRALTREGKRPSTPPPPHRITRPGY